jgi:hypothetical protein
MLFFLNLSSNRISFIERNSFSKMFGLEFLILENNFLIEFDPYAMLPFELNIFNLKHT